MSISLPITKEAIHAQAEAAVSEVEIRNMGSARSSRLGGRGAADGRARLACRARPQEPVRRRRQRPACKALIRRWLARDLAPPW
jgi:hypothetical protein